MFRNIFVLIDFALLKLIGSEYIFTSTLMPSSSNDSVDIGLSLNKTSLDHHLNFPNGFTFCERFNYRILGRDPEPKTIQLVSIGCQHNYHADCLWTYTGYKLTFMGLGKFNWILKNPHSTNNAFIVWTANRWHQVCNAYDAKSQKLIFVKVSFFFNSGKMSLTKVLYSRMEKSLTSTSRSTMSIMMRCKKTSKSTDFTWVRIPTLLQLIMDKSAISTCGTTP